MVSAKVLKRPAEEPGYQKQPVLAVQCTIVKDPSQLRRIIKFQEAWDPNMDGDG